MDSENIVINKYEHCENENSKNLLTFLNSMDTDNYILL